MKKYVNLYIIPILIVLAVAVFCNRIPQRAKRTITSSELYSVEDINLAMDAVEKKFRSFKGCDLIELRYDDSYMEKEKNYIEAAALENKDYIILLSAFYVSENGGDGSLIQDYTYTNWNWILQRDVGKKKWTVTDWGY